MSLGDNTPMYNQLDELAKGQEVRINFIPDTSITISYRMWLAGLAMQGMLPNITEISTDYKHYNCIKHAPKLVAEIAVVYADALIAQLEKAK